MDRDRISNIYKHTNLTQMEMRERERERERFYRIEINNWWVVAIENVGVLGGLICVQVIETHLWP
jgi:hypothetical protein